LIFSHPCCHHRSTVLGGGVYVTFWTDLTVRPSPNDYKKTDFANADPEKQTLVCFVFFAASSNDFVSLRNTWSVFRVLLLWCSGLEKAAVATNPEKLCYSVTTGRKHPRCPKSTKNGAAVTRNELFGVVTLATMVFTEFNDLTTSPIACR
jgi:hypothetical protein